MPIQSDDIKLLKSAVMADVPEGGGGATGVEIIDGQSNNILPDTSTDDRAGGRFQLRKIFGAAHTDDTDTLMGASFAVLAPPADPLVHVALFETPGWADTREAAIDRVQRYMVKGPRLSCRIMGTHYEGSLLLQLYQVSGSNFPAAGDAVVLRNPDGQEQYVRVLKVTLSDGKFNSIESGNVVTFDANIAVCEIGQAIAFDVVADQPVRVINEASVAHVFSTTVSSGVHFHGVKPLADAASVGDRFVMADGGIYSPLVPAATVEQPLIDIAPLTTRQALSRTAQAALTLPAQSLAMQPGTLLTLPTAVQPASLTITRGSTVFTDDGNGGLLQGTTVVGSVDYLGKTATVASGAPDYGTASTVIAYRPATPSGAATHSAELVITSANQGLAFTAAFEPVPAPGTFTVSYMAQGRWYDLADNANGKLAGADSSYGAGQINYQTGSIAFTLGAVPDVGSSIIYTWGNAQTAVAISSENLPGRLQARLQINAGAMLGTEVLTWIRGGTSYTASVNASGVLTGDATGTRLPGLIVFEPAVLPDGNVSVDYDTAPTVSNAATNNGGGSYTLESVPAQPGSVRFQVGLSAAQGYALAANLDVKDNGMGALLGVSDFAANKAVGTIDYATGAVVVNSSVEIAAYETVIDSVVVGGQTLYFERREPRASYTATLANASVASISHTAGTPVAATASITPAWGLALPIMPGLSLKTDALAFAVGNATYTASGGSLRQGWNAVTGAGTPAGSVSSSGAITITALPSNGINSITWSNAAQDVQSPGVGQGVFRVQSAPIKTGVFQIQAGALVGNSNNSGVISGHGWYGSVDFERGIVRWNRTSAAIGAGQWAGGWATWQATNPVAADELTYNAVFLQYVPLDADLLGIETARLPLDGKVPIFRAGGQVLVHHTLHTQLPNPLTKGTAYSLGRERIAAATVRTATGARVSGALYTVDFSAGEIVFPVGSDLTGLAQPFDVEHRIEDELLALSADISGKISLVAGLTHDYPAGSSYVSSKLRKGDLFARAYGYTDQAAWTGVWSDDLIGPEPLASYNHTDHPITVTNRGAITERWALIFLSSTTVRVVGENVGQIMTGVSVNESIAPINPHTSAPYFSIPALGWGGGWAAGNVLRFNTAACGSAAWVSRAVLQGPATVASDSAVIAFRADVDA